MRKSIFTIIYMAVFVLSAISAAAAVPERIFVVDSDLRAVLEVNSSTGDRYIASSDNVGTGPFFHSPIRLITNSQNELFVIDSGLNAVLKINITNGNREIVFSNAIGVLHEGYFDNAGNLILTHSDTNTVSRFNLATGEHSILSNSTTGSGLSFSFIEGVAVDSVGNIYASDSGLAVIFKVDPSNGDRVIFDEGLSGSAPFYGFPTGLTIDNNNGIVLIDVTGIIPVRLIRIDIPTGTRNLISSRLNSGQVPEFYTQVRVSSNNDIVAVGPFTLVLRVDPITGNREVISSNTIGTGPLYSNLQGVALISAVQDADSDNVPDSVDNCASVANTQQENNDLDSLGDACDEDDDNDNVLDTIDNCASVANTQQENNDLDNAGDICDADDDNDGVADIDDAFPFDYTESQDTDLDTIGNNKDNCPFVSNTNQEDLDHDGIGGACDFGLAAADFIRGTSTPVKQTVVFESSLPAGVLKIYNGGLVDDFNEKVSSSVIYLNGQLLIGPDNFNQQTSLIEKQVILLPLNTLELELRGKPGGKITVVVQ